jgi:hypothetical protein
VSHKAKNLTPKHRTNLIQTLIDPPKEVEGERKANRKGYTLQSNPWSSYGRVELCNCIAIWFDRVLGPYCLDGLRLCVRVRHFGVAQWTL